MAWAIERAHGRVALVEDVRDDFRIAIDAQRELRQVVGADREAVEELGELGSRTTLLGISTITYSSSPLLVPRQAVARQFFRDAAAPPRRSGRTAP